MSGTNKLSKVTVGGVQKSYAYNADGTMKTDGLRGLTVTYNPLKLPNKIKVSSNTGTVDYIYDANGNKLAVKQGGTMKNVYCGDFVYNTSLSVDYILTPNGQLTRNPSTGAYTAQYNITDHLGNVRSVVNSGSTVLQSTDYYPFGLAFSDANITNNRYLYNGKELEDYTIGTSYLGTLDYGARHYDPRIARWTVPDPMAEKYYGVNAYSYCVNNPILLVDPTGLEILPKSVAEYTNSIPKYSYSRVLDEEYGPYTINAYYDSNDHIVGFSAVKAVKIGKTSITRFDYIMTSESDLSIFAENVSIFSIAADFMNANGDLSPGMIEMLSGDVAHGLMTQWKEAFQDPSFYIATLVSFSSIIEKRPYIYDPKVWNKASTEATMHNFPYSFDQVILKSRPLIKSGGYQIYRLPGTVNEYSGFFEIGVRKPNVIDHRFFRPSK